MDRRDLLARFGVVLGTASLGGCLGRYEDVVGGAGETTTDAADADGGTTTGDGTEETTTDGERDAEDAERPSVAETQFELAGSECGEPTGDASVGFREQSSSVVVTGTIPGASQCYVAELADASYDSEAGAFVVTVASTQKDGSEMCAQCITQIDYEATVTFEGGLPEAVEVVHEAMDESTTVAAVQSD